MGREYNGDITGKFWFGVQSSNDATFFHIMGTDAEEYETVWDCCGSLCEEGDEKCPTCTGEDGDEEPSSEKRPSESEVNYHFKNDEEQMKKLDEDLNKLCRAIGFKKEDLERFRELAKKADEKPYWSDEHKALCEAICNEGQESLTDEMKELLDDIQEHFHANESEYLSAFNENQARFHLGLQIEAVLKRQDTCTLWCEC
jgi:hypothetical protein